MGIGGVRSVCVCVWGVLYASGSEVKGQEGGSPFLCSKRSRLAVCLSEVPRVRTTLLLTTTQEPQSVRGAATLDDRN